MSDTQSSTTDFSLAGPAVFAAPADLKIIGEQLERLRRAPSVLQAGGPAEAMQWCARNTPPSILLIDIGGHAHPLSALLELAAQAGPACRIVALGQAQDVDLYRQLLQAGIFDYLTTPPRLDLLAGTLARADDDAPLGHGGAARAGRTVAFTGSAGGVGVSTLTAALGAWLAQSRQTPTVMVDFDRRKGDLPLLLGLQADAGLASLLAAPEIDPRLLQRTLLALKVEDTDVPTRLHLLAQQPGAETPVEAERVLELGAVLCQLFSLSLWDLPSHRPNGADEVLAHADIRVVLTELTVQGARNTHRLLRQLGDESGGQRLLLVASGARDAGRPDMEFTQFEDFVGRAIDLHLPYAGNALSQSLLQGPLAVAPGSAYGQAVARLGARVLGLPESTGEAAPEGVAQRLRAWLSRPAPAARPRASARA